MTLPRIHFHDPIDLMLRCYQRLWPDGRDVEIFLVPAASRAESPLPEGALGVTSAMSDGPWGVFIVAEQTVEQLLDILAHELAHVVAGPEAEHGSDWMRALEQLRAAWLAEVERGEWSRLGGLRGELLRTTTLRGEDVRPAAQRVLDAIQDLTARHGAPPSLREVEEATGRGGAKQQVDALVRAGLLFDPGGASRMLVSTEAGWLHRGMRLEPPLDDGLAVRALWMLREQIAVDRERAVLALDRARAHLAVRS